MLQAVPCRADVRRSPTPITVEPARGAVFPPLRYPIPTAPPSPSPTPKQPPILAPPRSIPRRPTSPTTPSPPSPPSASPPVQTRHPAPLSATPSRTPCRPPFAPVHVQNTPSASAAVGTELRSTPRAAICQPAGPSRGRANPAVGHPRPSARARVTRPGSSSACPRAGPARCAPALPRCFALCALRFALCGP